MFKTIFSPLDNCFSFQQCHTIHFGDWGKNDFQLHSPGWLCRCFTAGLAGKTSYTGRRFTGVSEFCSFHLNCAYVAPISHAKSIMLVNFSILLYIYFPQCAEPSNAHLAGNKSILTILIQIICTFLWESPLSVKNKKRTFMAASIVATIRVHSVYLLFCTPYAWELGSV